MKMTITVFGTGYVGLVSGVGFANLGHEVVCMDHDKKKIDSLKKGKLPIYEVGLTELLTKNANAGRIRFTTDAAAAVNASDMLFLALPTPSLPDGKTDASALHSVAVTIGKHMKGYKIIINKSTAPVGALKELGNTIRKHTRHPFDMASNPEFLKEGTAINDFLRPDRIVVGVESEEVALQMKRLYRPLLMNGHPLLIMDIASAELTKYAANCMLATRIAFMNQVANLCDRTGANIDSVREGLAKDSRIGPKFLYAGVGYGGSCFPKDVRSLIYTGHEQGVDLSIAEAVNACNENQWKVFFNKLLAYFNNRIKGKKFAVWGLSFKPHTDDVREAPSLSIIDKLVKEGAHVTAHDPVAMANARKVLLHKTIFEEDPYRAAEGAHALLLVTEWPSYRNPDYGALKKNMQQRVVFDGRNALDPEETKKEGFIYFGIGKQ